MARAGLLSYKQHLASFGLWYQVMTTYH